MDDYYSNTDIDSSLDDETLFQKHVVREDTELAQIDEMLHSAFQNGQIEQPIEWRVKGIKMSEEKGDKFKRFILFLFYMGIVFWFIRIEVRIYYSKI